LLAGSYQGFIDAGYLTGYESARYQATLLQPAARYGVTAVINWIEGRLDATQSSQIEIAARQGQYAIDFVTTFATELNPAREIAGFTNTVERTDIDFAVTEIIGNSKIPPIEYADIVAELVNQSGIAVDPGATTNEDGTFRFAPGAPRG
jgi:hypothetical protein